MFQVQKPRANKIRSMKRVRHSKSRVRVRRATTRDLDLLVRHRRAMWVDMGEQDEMALSDQDRAYRSWALSRLRTGTLLGWLIDADRNGVVASGVLWLRPSVPRPRFKHLTQPFLLSMYTEPEWRRRGLASRIVAEATRWAKRNGYEEILLHANPMSRRVYPRQRFSRTWEMKREL